MPDNEKLGLALSGGGFRATLFHLGMVKLLRETETRIQEDYQNLIRILTS